MKAVQTILKVYEGHITDLLYDEAVDLASLLNDEQLDDFFSKNPKFITLSTGDFRNIKDLNEMINMLVDYMITI